MRGEVRLTLNADGNRLFVLTEEEQIGFFRRRRDAVHIARRAWGVIIAAFVFPHAVEKREIQPAKAGQASALSLRHKKTAFIGIDLVGKPHGHIASDDPDPRHRGKEKQHLPDERARHLESNKQDGSNHQNDAHRQNPLGNFVFTFGCITDLGH